MYVCMNIYIYVDMGNIDSRIQVLALGYRVEVRDIAPMMQNQMEDNTEHEKQTTRIEIGGSQ